MEPIIQLNSEAKLSDHFTLGEMTKSSSHPEVYNIPSHEVIANLKRLCVKKTPCFMLMRRGVLVFRADPEINTDAGRQSTRCFRSWCRW